MSNDTLNLRSVLSRPPFRLPSVRSSFKGNVVHIGVQILDFRLRAACHAETNVITMAQPTGDTVSCSNCLSRDRRGLIPRTAGIHLAPNLVLSALSIWRTALADLRAAVQQYELRRISAYLDDGAVQLPELRAVPVWLALELVDAFALYQAVADGPVVSMLVAEVAEKLRQVAFPSGFEVPVAA